MRSAVAIHLNREGKCSYPLKFRIYPCSTKSRERWRITVRSHRGIMPGKRSDSGDRTAAARPAEMDWVQHPLVNGEFRISASCLPYFAEVHPPTLAGSVRQQQRYPAPSWRAVTPESLEERSNHAPHLFRCRSGCVARALRRLCPGAHWATATPAVQPGIDGVGFGSGHFSGPPTETTAISLRTAAVVDSITRSGPGFGSGH